MKLLFSYTDTYLSERSVSGDNDEETNRYGRYLAAPVDFLLGRVIKHIDEALEDIRKVESGEESEVIIYGNNDTDLILKPTGGQLDILIDDNWHLNPKGHFTLSEWKHAFEGWKQFLSMPKSRDTVVEVDLDTGEITLPS